MDKTYVWTFPNRVFHLLLIVLTLFMFFSDDDNMLIYHVMAGYCLALVLLFRIVWGFLGPKYSKFKDFPLEKNQVKIFIEKFFTSPFAYVGHNPIASYFMIAMIFISVCLIISGIATYGAEEHKGLFASLSWGGFEDIHETFSNLLILLVLGHLLGIIIDKVMHKEHETLKSIFTGYKVTYSDESVKLAWWQKLIAIVFLVFFLFLLYYFTINPQNFLTA